MGKKKNKTINKSMWGHQNPKKYAELKERYNVSGAQGGKPDNYGPGSERRTKEDVYDDIMHAARNDYDTRRSLEAAGLSGNKKAAKMSAGGFNNITDVAKSQNILRRLKKKHVGGGGMGGAENIMGLTDALVNRDRNKLNESIDERISEMSVADQVEEAKDTGFTDPENREVSPEMQAAKDRVTSWEGKDAGTNSAPYGGADDQQAEATLVADSTDRNHAAQGFLAQQKEKMKQERNFKRDF